MAFGEFLRFTFESTLKSIGDVSSNVALGVTRESRVSYRAGNRTLDLELTTLSSTHHVELNPNDAGFQDRYVVQEIIKEMAKNRPIDTKGKKGSKHLWRNL